MDGKAAGYFIKRFYTIRLIENIQIFKEKP